MARRDRRDGERGSKLIAALLRCELPSKNSFKSQELANMENKVTQDRIEEEAENVVAEQ